MREAAHHRQFVKSLYAMIKAHESEDERKAKVEAAVAAYAAALNEAAGTTAYPRPKRDDKGYVDLHLSNVYNQILALRNLPSLDQGAKHVCEAAMNAAEQQKQRLALLSQTARKSA
jgi:hypothetical protein